MDYVLIAALDSLWRLSLRGIWEFKTNRISTELFITDNICVLLRTKAEDEDENGHRCTPEAEQWDVLADGGDGGVDLQVRQVSRPLLGAAARVGAHALRHVAVERVGVTRLLHVIARWHLSEEYEHGLSEYFYNLNEIHCICCQPQYVDVYTHSISISQI